MCERNVYVGWRRMSTGTHLAFARRDTVQEHAVTLLHATVSAYLRASDIVSYHQDQLFFPFSILLLM